LCLSQGEIPKGDMGYNFLIVYLNALLLDMMHTLLILGRFNCSVEFHINAFSRKKLDATANELVEAKALACSCLN